MEEFFALLARGLFRPFLQFVANPTASIYWLYLLGTMGILVVLHVVKNRSLHGVLANCFPRQVFAHSSARTDYIFFLSNSMLLVALIFPYAVFSELQVAAGVLAVLKAIGGGSGVAWEAGWMAVVLFTVVNLLAIDWAVFFAHYLKHRVPLLWEFHKTHHSAEVLTPITAFRQHPVNLVLTIGMGAVSAGIVAAIFHFLYGEGIAVYTVNGLNIGLFLFYIAGGYHLRHSHVRVMYPPWLARHVMSPALHLFHHSNALRHADKNLGFIFTLWDRMAGTLYVPEQDEALELGLHGDEQVRFRRVRDLYFRAFGNLAGRRHPPVVAPDS